MLIPTIGNRSLHSNEESVDKERIELLPRLSDLVEKAYSCVLDELRTELAKLRME
jgi:hypothetical protein